MILSTKSEPRIWQVISQYVENIILYTTISYYIRTSQRKLHDNVHDTSNRNDAPPNITKYVYPSYLESLAVLIWRRECPIRGRGPPSPDNFKMRIEIIIFVLLRILHMRMVNADIFKFPIWMVGFEGVHSNWPFRFVAPADSFFPHITSQVAFVWFGCNNFPDNFW